MGIRDNMVNPFARDPFFSHTNGINAMTNSMMVRLYTQLFYK